MLEIALTLRPEKEIRQGNDMQNIGMNKLTTSWIQSSVRFELPCDVMELLIPAYSGITFQRIHNQIVTP